MRHILSTGIALGLAAWGAVNVAAAVRLEQLDALTSPDAWVPLSAALAGWLVTRLSGRNAVGWLLLAVAASSAVFGSAALVVLGGAEVPPFLLDLALWLSAWVWLPSYYITFLLVPLLFPDGALPSRSWQPVLLASSALVLGESLLLALGSRDSIAEGVPNPWHLAGVGSLLDAVEPVVWLSMPALALLGAASLVHRFLAGDPEQRRPTLALAAATAIGLGVYLTTSNGLVFGLLLPLVVAGSVAQLMHDRLRTQLRVAESQAAALRESRARITRAHDDARRRIERDLHDGAQQALLALSVDLGRLTERVAPDLREDAERVAALARRTLVELRRLAAGTYPSALRELGVAPALRDAVGHQVVIHDHVDVRPGAETEAALYFACLEAVTNARKHASAESVVVTLDRTDDGGFRFTVADDGTGVHAANGGTGLDGMADRLGSQGGSLAVDAAPGRGTTVVGTAYDAPR